jgi:hypothetical protein
VRSTSKLELRPELLIRRPQDRLMDVIHPGAVAVRTQMIVLPKMLRVDGHRFGAWSIFRAASALDLEDELKSADWQFFLMQPMVRAWGIGWGPGAALERALRKALGRAGNENLNALEIENVTFRRFLGIHLARLSACARQVQWGREYSYGGCAPVFRRAA